jgi:hypothetical protein
VTFAAPTGTLWLDKPSSFTGEVVSFGGQDAMDLPGIPFGAHTTLAYSENSSDTGGTLSITNGTHAAKIALLGNYVTANFIAAADGHGGTLITDPPVIEQLSGNAPSSIPNDAPDNGSVTVTDPGVPTSTNPAAVTDPNLQKLIQSIASVTPESFGALGTAIEHTFESAMKGLETIAQALHTGGSHS